LGSDGTSPITPDSAELLEENGPPPVEPVSLPATTTTPSTVSSAISSNPIVIPRIGIGGLASGRGSGNGFGLLSSSPGKSHAESSPPSGPVSLPPMGGGNVTGHHLGWSVKEMAASMIARQHTTAEEKNKRSDSLPVNGSPPTSAPAAPPPDILKPLPPHGQGLHAN